MNIVILNFILSTAVGGRIIRRESNRDTMIYNMARGFVKAGHKVTILASEEYRPTEEEREDFEVVYFKSRLPRLFKPAVLPYPAGLGKWLRRHRDTTDMALTVETFSMPTLIAARNIGGKLMIWQEMAFHQHMMGGVPAKLWYNVVARGLLSRIPVVPQSDSAYRFISRYMKRVTPTTVGHGSDSDVFYPQEGTNPEPYFTVISMLVARKQIDRIIRKFAAFTREYPDMAHYKLRIVGEGPEKEALERVARDEGVEDRVVFHGFMNHREFADIERRSSALLIDTRQDNNMVTVPEAIVNGTPVLTNRVPNNAAFVEESGTGIAKAEWDHTDLRRMVDEYATFHANCVAARERFTNRGVAAKLTELFNNRHNGVNFH